MAQRFGKKHVFIEAGVKPQITGHVERFLKKPIRLQLVNSSQGGSLMLSSRGDQNSKGGGHRSDISFSSGGWKFALFEPIFENP